MKNGEKINNKKIAWSPYVPELIDYFQSEVLFENDEPKRQVDLLVMELLDACAPFESVLNSFEHRCAQVPP